MQTTTDANARHTAPHLPSFAEIREHVRAARRMVNLGAQITDHPWHAVIAAGLIGAWVGLEAPTRAPGEPTTHSRIAGLIATTVGAIALRVVREVALRQASSAARRWYDHAVQSERAGSDPHAWPPSV